MDVQERYRRWKDYPLEDQNLTAELERIEGDEKGIYERFYTDLTFGTAGLRGILGAGTNRMNLYVVRQATQGMAEFILKHHEGPQVPAAAIAYDSRNKSELFAHAAAGVLAANGVRAYLYSALAPTPMLSWAVRYYHCAAGVMVTASHNPAEYNGYKAYGPDGCQMTSESADEVLSYIQRTDVFEGVRCVSLEEGISSGMIVPVGEDAIEAYYQEVLSCRCVPDAPGRAGLSLVYTPLNGTGNLPVRHILSEIGITDLTLVEEQLLPDGNFPTCSYPNPELREAMALGLSYAEKAGADLLIGTDPDADRLGVAVRRDGGYTLLTGNEVGVLLLDYIGRARTEQGTMPKNPVAVKSIVSTTLADLVAASYGIEMVNVLTGFKYIGDQIARLESKGEVKRFIFGFEESCGYLAGPYVRDKDAVVAAMLVAEMASYHKLSGRTLLDALDAIYEKFGCFYNHVTSTAFAGSDGMKKMAALMDGLFAAPPKALGAHPVAGYCDYRAGIRVKGEAREPIGLPASDVLSLSLENGATVVIRPSGTEPKLKVYYMVKGSCADAAKALCGELRDGVEKLLGL